MENKLDVINEYFNNYALIYHSDFFYRNYMFFQCLAFKILNGLQKNDFGFTISLEEEIDLFSSISLVKEFLGEIDPKYVPIFDQLVKNGSFDFKDYNDLEYEDETNSSVGCSLDDDDLKVPIDIILRHNYFDPYTIAHEFFHAQNVPQNPIMIDRRSLAEMVSIFFEREMLDFMEEKGYKKSDITQIRLRRNYETYNISKDLTKLIPWFHIYETFGDISEDTYKLDEQYPDEFFWETEEEYNKGIDILYSQIKTGEIVDFSRASQYLLGNVIVNYIKENKTGDNIKNMLEVNDILNNSYVTEALAKLNLPKEKLASKLAETTIEIFKRQVEEVNSKETKKR